MNKNKVEFTISEEFTYSKCRACGHRVLWFGVMDRDGYGLKLWHQNPTKENVAYCPYCGAKTLYKEDG
jgi:DNA-directed RNA polymerase subunit RPC12/RpoP